jgi:hypothetical protein
MNRIRKYDNRYQVIITPHIIVSPDSSLMLGNWLDQDLQNYKVISFDLLQDAQYEALKYPDIDWYRIIVNHKYIFHRLCEQLKTIINKSGINVEFIQHLMTPDEFKNSMFDRIISQYTSQNPRTFIPDIISFTIINPWTENLNKLSKFIEAYREHLYRDDMRIRHKKIIDDMVIYLYGVTEAKTVFQIKLIPTLLYHWSLWNNNNNNNNTILSDNLYKKYISQQNAIDNGYIRS